jgi:RNA polymerase sigma-70 factor (ECF subfamily)
MEYAKLSDNELVARSAGGDGRAFEILVQRHGALVMGLALARLGDRERSEDIVQDAFLRVFRKLGEYSRKAKFSTWLYRIASNLIKDNHKYARRHPVAPLTTEQVATDFRLSRSAASVDQGLAAVEKRQDVMDALGELTGDLREILILRDVQNMSYEEIAELTGCSMGTVKSRVSRARMKFKDAYVKVSRRHQAG